MIHYHDISMSLSFIQYLITNCRDIVLGRDSSNAFSSIHGLDPQRRELLEARFFDNKSDNRVGYLPCMQFCQAFIPLVNVLQSANIAKYFSHCTCQLICYVNFNLLWLILKQIRIQI
jgi:hypothetical protein